MPNRALRPLAVVAAIAIIAVLAAPPAAAGQAASAPAPKPAPVPPRSLTAHLIGHAHIDLSWLWRWEETVADIATFTFRGTLDQMDKLPGLTFAQSQAAIYEAVEKDQPALFERIARKIKEGTWVPVGGMWVEPDLNMPDGEALARQLLYGKRYFLDKFGVDVKVGWNPDTFGHSWQMPQILRRAGIDSYVFGRCAPSSGKSRAPSSISPLRSPRHSHRNMAPNEVLPFSSGPTNGIDSLAGKGNIREIENGSAPPSFLSDAIFTTKAPSPRTNRKGG